MAIGSVTPIKVLYPSEPLTKKEQRKEALRLEAIRSWIQSPLIYNIRLERERTYGELFEYETHSQQ